MSQIPFVVIEQQFLGFSRRQTHPVTNMVRPALSKKEVMTTGGLLN